MIMLLAVLNTLFLIASSGYGDNHGYPVPEKNDKLMFYIQRNHNANTIIYDAIFDEDGNLKKDEPIDVYWKRYEEENQRMELRIIEKWYAYGVKCSKVDGESNLFKVSLVADKSRVFWLKQLSPFKAMVITNINGKLCKLDHIYIYADESGFWPKVKYIELFGEDIQTSSKVYEKLEID